MIYLAEKYRPLLDDRFTHESFTEQAAGKEFDWDGVATVTVWTADAVSINNYNRTASGNRFGTPAEMGDTKTSYTLAQDKSFAFTIDKGNATEQFNVKKANQRLKHVWDEQMTPMVDRWRLNEWATGTGIQSATGVALTKSTAVEAIMTGNAALSNKLVPLKNRFIFVSNTLFVKCKLSDQIHYSDSMATEAYKNGVMGYLDGCPVIAVPDSYLPEGCQFLIKYKDSTVDPIKLKTMKVHTDPPGIDGDLCEGRLIFDAFVRTPKAKGIYVYALPGGVTGITGATGGTGVGA